MGLIGQKAGEINIMENIKHSPLMLAVASLVLVSSQSIAQDEAPMPINSAVPSVVTEAAVTPEGPVNATTATGAVNAAEEVAEQLPPGGVVNAESTDEAKAEAAKTEVSKDLPSAPAYAPLNSGVSQPGPAQSPPVKKSRSGECLPKGNSYYDKEHIYTPYPSLQACLASGGRGVTR